MNMGKIIDAFVIYLLDASKRASFLTWVRNFTIITTIVCAAVVLIAILNR